MTKDQIKDAVRQRDGYRCTVCGMTNEEHMAVYGRQLDVHRKSPGSLYALDETCTTLCRGCHGTQPRLKRGQPDLVNGSLVFARVPVALGKAFEAYIASLSPRCSKTSALSFALEEFLAKRGLWPPPPA